jgi:hypothetical protein
MGPEAGGAQLLGHYRGWGAASSRSGRVPAPPSTRAGNPYPPRRRAGLSNRPSRRATGPEPSPSGGKSLNPDAARNHGGGKPDCSCQPGHRLGRDAATARVVRHGHRGPLHLLNTEHHLRTVPSRPGRRGRPQRLSRLGLDPPALRRAPGPFAVAPPRRRRGQPALRVDRPGLRLDVPLPHTVLRPLCRLRRHSSSCSSPCC